MINDRTGYGSATAVPSKGAKHPFPVKWAERAQARSSGMRFVIQTDPENSAGQVAAEVASTAQKPTSTRKTPRRQSREQRPYREVMFFMCSGFSFNFTF